MNPYRYFIPQIGRNPMMYGSNNYNFFSILSKFGNNIKNFNWKGMLNGVNKTLNVVNQTIPLMKEAKPMYDNIKSMVQLTKAFKKETTNHKQNNQNIYQMKYKVKNITNRINTSDTNKPNFFI